MCITVTLKGKWIVIWRICTTSTSTGPWAFRVQNPRKTSGPASIAQLQLHSLWWLPCSASAFWELPMPHYKLQKQDQSRGHKEAIRATHGFTRCTSIQVYQWQLYYSCTAKFAHSSQSLHRSTCSLPKAHTPSHFTLPQVLDAPTNSTPSTVEPKVLGHLTCKMMTSLCVYSTDNTITVPTGQACCRNKTKQNCHKNQSGPKVVRAYLLWLP